MSTIEMLYNIELAIMCHYICKILDKLSNEINIIEYTKARLRNV